MNLYPSLQYPEIYLLHGGYKEFFESNSDLCDPIAYRPMLEPTFTDEYKHFRAKSKSWTGFGDIRASASNRLTKSRSRLVLWGRWTWTYFRQRDNFCTANLYFSTVPQATSTMCSFYSTRRAASTTFLKRFFCIFFSLSLVCWCVEFLSLYIKSNKVSRSR